MVLQKSYVTIACGTDREKVTIEKFLEKVYMLPDKKLQEVFNLFPHEVMDIRDALRKRDYTVKMVSC